jgi:hypothetical protein
VAELVRLKVDIIVVAGGDPMIQVAKNATKTIPIVMVGSGLDPVEAGHVESLARPGGNVTGITNLGQELGGKRGSRSLHHRSAGGDQPDEHFRIAAWISEFSQQARTTKNFRRAAIVTL